MESIVSVINIIKGAKNEFEMNKGIRTFLPPSRRFNEKLGQAESSLYAQGTGKIGEVLWDARE